MQDDGTCLREPPAYVQRDFSSVFNFLTLWSTSWSNGLEIFQRYHLFEWWIWRREFLLCQQRWISAGEIIQVSSAHLEIDARSGCSEWSLSAYGTTQMRPHGLIWEQWFPRCSPCHQWTTLCHCRMVHSWLYLEGDLTHCGSGHDWQPSEQEQVKFYWACKPVPCIVCYIMISIAGVFLCIMIASFHRKVESAAFKQLIEERGYELVSTEVELNGPERFAADGIINEEQCQALIRLANVSQERIDARPPPPMINQCLLVYNSL